MCDKADHLKEIEKLKLAECRAYITGQANVFDTTDTKTGAALGFAFIAIFQILAGILRANPDIFHRNCVLSCLLWASFGILLIAFLTALVASAVSRWPREFTSHAEIADGHATELSALAAISVDLEQAGERNAVTLNKKRFWAQVTYGAVTVAIIASLLLSTVLFISIAAFPPSK